MVRYSFSFAFFCLIGGNDLASAIFRTIDEAAGSKEFVFEQVHSHINNVVTFIESSRSLLSPEEVLESKDICGGFNLIADQIPNGENSCVCQDSHVHCTLQGECNVDRSVCTDIVGMSFQFLVQKNQIDTMVLSACFTYTDQFEPTCIETMIGHGQTLQQCNKATYGGKTCLCGICNDKKSLALDCTKHNPLATSNGCYLLSDALPALSKFDEPPLTAQRPPGPSRRATEMESSDGTSMSQDLFFFVIVLVATTTIMLP